MLSFERQLVIASAVAACVVSSRLLHVLFLGVYDLRAALQMCFITLAGVSLCYLVVRRNWARRTWLILGFVWGVGGLVAQLQVVSAPIAVAGAASIGLFIWLMRRQVRDRFTAVPRTWGFARIVAGAALLTSSAARLLAPSAVDGPLPTFRIEGDAEFAGAAFSRLLMILFSLWLVWSGVRKERAGGRDPHVGQPSERPAQSALN